MGQNFVLVVKVASKHLCRLVDGMLYLDRNATSCLRFLHDLFNEFSYRAEHVRGLKGTNFVCFVIDLQRSAN
jgi:uncharacterized protein YerC